MDDCTALLVSSGGSGLPGGARPAAAAASAADIRRDPAAGKATNRTDFSSATSGDFMPIVTDKKTGEVAARGVWYGAPLGDFLEPSGTLWDGL